MALKFIQGLYSFVLVLITWLTSKYFTDIGLDNFYETINISNVSPENSYFTIIWKGLYFLLFFSFYLILTSKKSIEQFDDVNTLFLSQLFLQILWCFSFFYMEQMLASAIVIILLVGVVMLMMHSFYYINKLSFWLCVPYIAWLLFASYLNIYIAVMN
jgi:tryptophan-rich sensory protein